jgi:hypothetical protein
MAATIDESLSETLTDCLGECRRLPRGNLFGRVDPIQMRDMAMAWFGLSHIMAPLFESAGLIDVRRREFG